MFRTEILSIEFWAAASEVTPIYYSKSYLHNISTARAHSLNFKYTFIAASSFGLCNHGLTVTEPRLAVLPGSVNFWSGYGLDLSLIGQRKHSRGNTTYEHCLP